MQNSKESSISREAARRILASVGETDLYDPAGDYYVAIDDQAEYLMVWGNEQPLATQCFGPSWLPHGPRN